MSARSTLRKVAGVASIVVVALGVAACGSDDNGGGSTGGSSTSSGDKSPIVVGNISALSGGIVLPYGANGAKAYFDSLNKKGGVNGRQVKLIAVDDKSDPTVAATQARKLIQQDNVVAFAGGVSLVDCTVNGKLYQREDVKNVMGGASDPTCFTNPNISAVNTGVLTGITAALYWMYKDQKVSPVCNLNNNIPTLNAAYPKAVQRFTELTGQKPAFSSNAAGPNANWTTLMLQVKRAGCKGLVATMSGPQVPALTKAAKQVGYTGKIIFGGAAYDMSTPGALGADGEGISAVAELFPFTQDDPVLDPIKADFAAAKVELTGLSEAGWLAAKILADTMAGIKGDINRDSVNKALLALTSYDTKGLTATPYAFGPGDAHNSNQSIWPVVIQDGKWNAGDTTWVTLPDAAKG